MVLKEIIEKLTEIFKEKKEKRKRINIWKKIAVVENTQAYHILNVLDFEKWKTMEEIRRDIFKKFKVVYKNEKSLYPYIKTLTDINLLETVSAGGKRRWRKRKNPFK